MIRNKLKISIGIVFVTQLVTGIYPIEAKNNIKSMEVMGLNEITKLNESQIIERDVIEVPKEALIMDGTTINGISKEWFRLNCSENNNDNPAYVNIVIGDNALTIGSKAFSTSKANYDTNPKYTYIHPSNYKVNNIDFSEATSLKSIERDAFMGNVELQGIVELPDSLEVIKGGAFRNCAKLEGVYLPNNLRELGNADSGSVFTDCKALQFVRLKGSAIKSTVELPSNLETIGRDLFNRALMYAPKSPLIIPESVKFIGIEAFNTPAISTITVEADDVSEYHGKAFQASSYGIGDRLTVFPSYNVYKSFLASGLQSYKNSLTFTFLLTYGDTGRSEEKLHNQPIRCVKNDIGNWFLDENYILPIAPTNDSEGYMGGWVYNGSLITPETIILAASDSVRLNSDDVLVEPTIQFIVDGKIRNQSTSNLMLYVSNDKEHQIGIKATHPLEGANDVDGYVEFAYKWTDIWSKNAFFYEHGPRMSEEGFGSILTGKPTIPINGAIHERSENGGYTNDDYGAGYYLVEIYGYFVKNGQKDLFYKSASTAFGAGSNATTNTAYTFNVLTSHPAISPDVEIKPLEIVYGYEDAKLEATILPIEGQIHTFQWYSAKREGQIQNGTAIANATSSIYNIPKNLDAGTFYYYLEVVSIKTQNSDVAKKIIPITLTVHKAGSLVQMEQVSNKVYDGEFFETPKLITKNGSKNKERYTWYQKQNDDWLVLEQVPKHTGEYKVKVNVDSDNNYLEAVDEKTFMINKAENKWIQEPEIKGWVYGGQEYKAIADAIFGDTQFTYSKEKSGTYKNEIPKEAGFWYVKASVDETKDYTGLETILEFNIEKAMPEINIPQGLSIMENENIVNLKLPKGYTWMDEEQSAGMAGDKTFMAYYTPEDIENYAIISNIEIPVSVLENKNKTIPVTGDMTNLMKSYLIVIFSLFTIVIFHKKKKI